MVDYSFNMNILIAGGSGFVGQALSKYLRDTGHTVYTLSRSPKQKNEILWDPKAGYISESEFNATIDVIVNLAGAGINDKRWTSARKQELYDSRIGSNICLFNNRLLFPNLKHFISASGITAYPFDDGSHLWKEDEQFGDAYIAKLVEQWEQSAALFSEFVVVAQIRIAVVFGKHGGALPLLVKLTNAHLGGPVGTGKQMMPWVSVEDLVRLFHFVIDKRLQGVFNSNAGNISNRQLMTELRLFFRRRLAPPAVPGFILKIAFGERSILLLEGNSASNLKIVSAGFSFKYPTVIDVLKHNYKT